MTEDCIDENVEGNYYSNILTGLLDSDTPPNMTYLKDFRKGVRF